MKALRWSSIATASLALLLPACASAQMSLTTAVDLALRNSPKIRMAQADITKAKASLSESKDAFIPMASSNAGVGKSSGPPLSVPIVFAVSAQSLVFSFSQPDYIRAARAGVAAAELTLSETRNSVVEDTATTYIGLDNAQRRRIALADAVAAVDHLVHITQDRFNAGVDPHIELTRSQRTAALLHLQQLQLEDEIDAFATHLTNLTGVTTGNIATVPDSIPEYFPIPAAGSTPPIAPDSFGIRAAYANATSKQYEARGETRYRWRPQLAFGATYSRINTAFTNYSDFYPAFVRNGDENAFSMGIQITVPILDITHQSRARSATAEALRLRAQADDQKMQFNEGRTKLGRQVAELSAHAELAARDRDLAQDELDAVKLQLQASSSATQGPQMTPRDEQNAMLQERQRTVDMLAADLQLRQTQIMLMRQQGILGDWLLKAINAPGSGSLPSAPSIPVSHP